MRPGIIPILHFPGEITPGQFGPISRVSLKSTTAATRTISSTGIPSVIQITKGISASAASRIASAANGGGTKITEAFAPVSFTASRTVLKTGRSRCFVPPFPGVTPPTTTVPYPIMAEHLPVGRHRARVHGEDPVEQARGLDVAAGVPEGGGDALLPAPAHEFPQVRPARRRLDQE